MNRKELAYLSIFMMYVLITDFVPFFVWLFILYAAAMLSILPFWKAIAYYIASTFTLVAINPDNWFVFQYPFSLLFVIGIAFSVYILIGLNTFYIHRRLKHVQRIHK